MHNRGFQREQRADSTVAQRTQQIAAHSSHECEGSTSSSSKEVPAELERDSTGDRIAHVDRATRRNRRSLKTTLESAVCALIAGCFGRQVPKHGSCEVSNTWLWSVAEAFLLALKVLVRDQRPANKIPRSDQRVISLPDAHCRTQYQHQLVTPSSDRTSVTPRESQFASHTRF